MNPASSHATPASSPPPAGGPRVFFALLVTSLLAFSLTRIHLVVASELDPSDPSSTSRLGLLLPVFLSEAWILAVGSFLLALAARLSSRPASLLPRVAFALLLLAMAVDVAIYAALDTRFYGGFLITYAREPTLLFRYLAESLGGTVTALCLLALGIACFSFPLWTPLPVGRRLPRVTFGFAVLAALLACLPPLGNDVDRWKRVSLIELNLPNPERIRYQNPPATTPPPPSVHRLPATEPDTRNVVLLIIESWSAYQSSAFGGIHDWTPALDAIARRHTRFDHFYAGGYDTNDGLLHLLGGARLRMPFDSAPKLSVSAGRWDQAPTLPRLLKDAGYHTAFLTTGPATFSNKNLWLDAIGFQEIEGGTHPFYEGWPRPSFGSPPDEALYRRSLAWLDTTGAAPFFLTIETVSSHTPGIDPDTGERGDRAAFRYTDRWAAWFYDELVRRDFFRHGILLVTGDHRAMLAASREEKETLGPLYPARIPLILADSRLPPGEIISEPYQQSDLLPSFRHRLGQSIDLDERSASLFEPSPRRGSLVFHRRGRERGWIDVLSPGGGHGVVLVKGDATDFATSENLTAAERSRILALIARERTASHP